MGLKTPMSSWLACVHRAGYANWVSPGQFPHPQLWVSPRRSPGSLREFLLAQSCDCVPWPTGFILAMCFCLLPWHLPCLLPLGPLAPEQQVLALWLLLLTLPHGVCCFLCPPFTAAPAIPTPYLFFCFRRRGAAVGYTVVIAQPDALSVYIQ